VRVDEEPGEDARLRVVEPQEPDCGQRDRRGPWEEDEEAQDPPSAELPHECVRQQARADDDDRL